MFDNDMVNMDLMYALQKLVDKLEEIHENPSYQGVFAQATNHGLPYTGPTYKKELDEAKQILGSLNN